MRKEEAFATMNAKTTTTTTTTTTITTTTTTNPLAYAVDRLVGVDGHILRGLVLFLFIGGDKRRR